jgi:hypothetical protein
VNLQGIVTPKGGGICNILGTLTVGTSLFEMNTPDHSDGSYTDRGGNTFIGYRRARACPVGLGATNCRLVGRPKTSFCSKGRE